MVNKLEFYFVLQFVPTIGISYSSKCKNKHTFDFFSIVIIHLMLQHMLVCNLWKDLDAWTSFSKGNFRQEKLQ